MDVMNALSDPPTPWKGELKNSLRKEVNHVTKNCPSRQDFQIHASYLPLQTAYMISTLSTLLLIHRTRAQIQSTPNGFI